MAAKRQSTSASDVVKLQSRVSEQYILTQYEGTTDIDTFIEWKQRIDDFKALYRGDWFDLYPDGTDMPAKPLIENMARGSIHDISGLAADTQPTIVFSEEDDSKDATVAAYVKSAIADTHWATNNGPMIEKQLYMDLLGAGVMVMAAAYVKGNPYPVFTRLDPARCWPDVRNGRVEDMLYIENIKVREAARMFPDEDLAGIETWSADTCRLIDYYDDQEVVKALLFLGKNGKPNKKVPVEQAVRIVGRWEHGLECVPVALSKFESFDGAFRGQYDQAGPPLLTRNKAVQYLTDYLYDMVHASFEEKNVRNSDDPPGPDTVYHHDPSADQSFIRRVAPAAPAGQVFGFIQYLEAGSAGENLQPPARQGDISQSQATGSFVASTQGRLTTAVSGLQKHMGDLREQLTYIGFKIDKRWLDTKKPLWRSVGRKKAYAPHTDIGDYVYCHAAFGAAAGIGKAAADVRVLQHLGAKIISLKTAREQVDYLEDPSSQQDEIDAEDANSAFKQRLLEDPRTPLSIIAKVVTIMAAGGTLVDAAEQTLPELQQADQAQQQAQAGGQPGQPGEPVTPGTTPDAGEQAQALESGATQVAPANVPAVNFGPPPYQTQIVGNNRS